MTLRAGEAGMLRTIDRRTKQVKDDGGAAKFHHSGHP